MEITDLINQIFSAQGMNQVNASITSSKKFAEIAIFTVSNAMGERIEPEFVEPIYNAYDRVIPITPLNSKELEKFKSTQNYLYECQAQSIDFNVNDNGDAESTACAKTSSTSNSTTE